MKKFLLIVCLFLVAFFAYQFGVEDRIYGIEYLLRGLRYNLKLDFIIIGLIASIWNAGYYSLKLSIEGVGSGFLRKHKNKLLLFSVLLVSGVNVNSGFEDNSPRIYNVKLFGAIPDGIETNDGSISSSSQTLTCTTCGFTSKAVGKYIVVAKAGSSSAPLYTTISAFTNSTTVTLTDAAGTTVTSGGNVIWGTENTAAIQAAINAQFSSGVGKTWCPNGNGTGMYIIGAALTANTPLGYAVNAQIYIPSNSALSANSTQRTAVTLEGESIGPQYPAPGAFSGAKFASTGIILRSTIAGSGILPSVIGFPNVTDGFVGVGSTDGYLKNIWIKVYTNQGALAPSISGVNGNFAGSLSLYNMSASIDVIAQVSQDPSAKEVAGFIVSKLNGNGPNIIDRCFASGFKYGFILGEHTQVISLFSQCNYYGLCLPHADYGVRGYAILHWNRIEIYAPNSGTNFLDNQNGVGQCNVSLECELETLDTLSSTRWYGGKDQPRIADSNSFLHGNIRVSPEISGGAKDVPMNVISANNLVVTYLQNNSNVVGSKSLLSFTSNGLLSGYLTVPNWKSGSGDIQGIALGNTLFGDNAHFNGSSFLYDSAAPASWIQFATGGILGRLAISGSAAGTITPINAFSFNPDLSGGAGGNGAAQGSTNYWLNWTTAGLITPKATNTQDFGSSTLTWRSGLFSGAESHGFVNVSGTGTYSALGTDRTIQFTGTTATLAYPTVNLINGRHLNIVNNGSGALTIPTTTTANATTVTTLASGGKMQVEYDLTNTKWIQVN